MPSFVQIVADAWNGAAQSHHCLWSNEKRALCVLCYVEPAHAERRWEDLPGAVRERLVGAVRQAIEFGAACSSLILHAERR